MKKALLLLFLLVFLCFPIRSNAVVTNSFYSIKVNLFYENNCKKCDEAKEWLEEYKKENYINVEYININDDKNLYNDVKKILNIKKNKMPLIIIGSNYFIGFNEETKNNLKSAIDSYEKADTHCDLVAKVKADKDTKECITKNKNIYNQATEISIVWKILIVIFSISLIIGAILIIKKKKIK